MECSDKWWWLLRRFFKFWKLKVWNAVTLMVVWMLLGAGTSSTALASVNPELLINRFTFIDNAACVTTAAHSESVAAPETVSANFVREFQFYPLPHSHNPLTNHTLRSSKSLLASRARSAAICSDKKYDFAKFIQIHPNSSKFIQKRGQVWGFQGEFEASNAIISLPKRNGNAIFVVG